MSDPAPGRAPGASGANLFRLPSVRIAVALDAASLALSAVLYVITDNPLVFALPVLAGAWLVFAVIRARRTLLAPPAAPKSDQIVQ